MLSRMILIGITIGCIVGIYGCDRKGSGEKAETARTESNLSTAGEKEANPLMEAEENVAEETEPNEDEGIPDKGQPCNIHSYILSPNDRAVLEFTIPIGIYSQYPTFSVSKNEAEQKDLEVSVDDVDTSSTTIPVWLVDANGYLTFPTPIYQAYRGYSIGWDTDNMGIVMINNANLKTGFMSKEEILNTIKDVRIEASFPATKSGAQATSAKVPLELIQGEREIYFATVSVEVSIPDQDEELRGRIYFKGDPAGDFMLSVHQMTKHGPVQIIGPDNGPECYQQE